MYKLKLIFFRKQKKQLTFAYISLSGSKQLLWKRWYVEIFLLFITIFINS